MFDGGTLDDARFQAVDLTDGELRGYRLVQLNDVEDLVRPRLWRRLQQVLSRPAAPGGLYLEDGSPPAPTVAVVAPVASALALRAPSPDPVTS